MLQQLLQYDNIAIQCHNIPDADSIASGFGIHRYFEAHGKKPIFFYAGPAISKPNLVGMINELEIPIKHMPDLDAWDGLLITVDCQYGMGNVKKVQANHVAVIDHHIQESVLPQLCDLRPWLGSCATLVWDLLMQQAFPIDTTLGTALLYGLFMDTNGFSELNHPLDRDMWEALIINELIFKQLKLSNLSLDDLFQTSVSINQLQMLEQDLRVALIPAPPCDPNILGFISDLATQVDNIDTVVAYSTLPSGDIKFSVRTTTCLTKASDLASWIANSFGSGGGHKEKAGGYIVYAKFKEATGESVFGEYCEKRIYEYFEKFKTLNCLQPETYQTWTQNITTKQYKKRIVPLGFVNTTEILGPEISLHVRTLEGDIHIKSHKDTFIMIGIDGEVYPIERAVFEKNYRSTAEPFTAQLEYPPSVLNINSGRRISLMEHARTCYSKESAQIQAMRLGEDQYLKIFTSWDQENYYSGNPGDWFVMRTENDFYIVNKDIFDKIYTADLTE